MYVFTLIAGFLVAGTYRLLSLSELCNLIGLSTESDWAWKLKSTEYSRTYKELAYPNPFCFLSYSGFCKKKKKKKGGLGWPTKQL